MCPSTAASSRRFRVLSDGVITDLDKPLYERKAYASLAEAKAGDITAWIERTRGKAKLALVNPDIDGLLSYCILKLFDPSLRFGGYYFNEYQLLLSEEGAAERHANPRSTDGFLSVENDLLIMDSIGQHFCILDDHRFAKINPNVLRYGKCSKENFKNQLRYNFSNKYPFSTTFFLWLILDIYSGKAIDDEQLIGLLYPDSAIVKSFGKTYRRNIDGWFSWLGQSNLIEHFERLHGTPKVIQIARCFYKKIDVTQPSVMFDGTSKHPKVQNKIEIQKALEFFCKLLRIPPCEVYDGKLEAGWQYHYTRIHSKWKKDVNDCRKVLYAWLESNIANGVNVFSTNETGEKISLRVVSEAMTTNGVWSVTTAGPWNPASAIDIAFENAVVSGRNAELSHHIDNLGLNGQCVPTVFGCSYLTDKDCGVSSG